MPRITSRRQQEDNRCMELFLWAFFLYTMINFWVPACSWYFNQYCFSAYTFMTGVRKYQAAVLDSIEVSKRHQFILMGVVMPLFIAHTVFGGYYYFTAPLIECRAEYQGEVFYIIMFMFEVSMCLVFVLLGLCVLIPTWIKNRNRSRSRARL